MNLVKFEKSENSQKIAYCIIDTTQTFQSEWTKELIKNQSDYTITNIHTKGYNIFQSQSEDSVLQYVSTLCYTHAVVISTGTELIDGSSFFNAIEKLVDEYFFVAGHILDRGDAYYELHQQCYVINLEIYNQLGKPNVLPFEPGRTHIETIPQRSLENFHDNYTPLYVSTGTEEKEYKHAMHGWNILKLAFDNNIPVLVFDQTIRNSKKYYYPEVQSEFNKHISWAYKREQYCADEFIHVENTEKKNCFLINIKQVFVPASGTWWTSVIDQHEPVTVVFYDYNDNALNYWKTNAPNLSNVTYRYVKLDLLHNDIDISKLLDVSIKDTFINLSNIFAYEGTTFFASLDYRLRKENDLLKNIAEFMPESTISFSARASTGFVDTTLVGKAKDMELVRLDFLTQPTWHRDWI